MKKMNLMSILLLIEVVTVLAASAWAIRRGFDITDEGFYLTSSQYPLAVTATTTFYFKYTALLFELVKQDIVLMRALGYCLMLASGLYFSLNFSRLTRRILPNWPISDSTAILFVLLGTLFYYAQELKTPNYNLLNVVSIQLSLGFLFNFLRTDFQLLNAVQRVRKLAILLGCGISIGFELLIKFPSAILMFFAYVVTLVIWPGLQIRMRAKAVVLLLGGLCLWLLIHALIIEPVPQIIRQFQSGVRLVHATSPYHGVVFLLWHYTWQLSAIAYKALRAFWACHLFFLALYLVKRFGLLRQIRFQKYQLIPLLFGIIISYKLTFTASSTTSSALFLDNSLKASQLFFGWLFIIGDLAVLSYLLCPSERSKNRATSWHVCILGSLLLATPFFSAFGTDNPIYMNMILMVAPLSALTLLLTGLLSPSIFSRPQASLILLIIATYASSQIAMAGITQPTYRQLTGYFQQTTRTQIGNPGTILLLDAKTSHFFITMQMIARRCHMKPEATVLAFYDMPGLVFALGAKSIGVPWYLGGYPGTVVAANTTLKWIPAGQLRRAFIIQYLETTKKMPDLAAHGIQFPQNYIFCGEATWPLGGAKVKLWEPIRQ